MTRAPGSTIAGCSDDVSSPSFITSFLFDIQINQQQDKLRFKAANLSWFYLVHFRAGVIKYLSTKEILNRVKLDLWCCINALI